jgi:rod shape-determining protein MreB and related proteins
MAAQSAEYHSAMLSSRLSPVLYLQLSAQRLHIRKPKSGEQIDEVPEIAISRAGGRSVILAVGAPARAAAAGAAHAELSNPFAHPRSLVSDFTIAEQVIKFFVQRISGKGWLSLAPIIVMHPLGEHEGGLTQVEIRALRELALGAGACRVQVWQGPQLSDAQLLANEFPSTGQLLA